MGILAYNGIHGKLSISWFP